MQRRSASLSPTRSGNTCCNLHSPINARRVPSFASFASGEGADSFSVPASVPTPSLVYVASQQPRARSDALDLYLSAVFSSLEVSKGLTTLFFLGVFFSFLTTTLDSIVNESFILGARTLADFFFCPTNLLRDLVTILTLLFFCTLLAVLAFLNTYCLAHMQGKQPSVSPFLLRHFSLSSVHLVFTVAFMGTRLIAPLPSAVGIIFSMCILLKTHSFSMTNLLMLREGSVGWPANITLPSFCYFLCAPTLTYESSYPSSPSIRLSYLCYKAAMGVCSALCGFCSLYYFIVPVLLHPQPPSSLHMLPSALQAPCAFLLDGLRLAVPSLCLWVSLFVGFFSCFLCILAELMRFADREFYGVWWDAGSIGAFWSLWNKPVHVWAKRHLLLELQIYLHLKKRGAVLATFVLSAILHEVVLSTAFKVVRPYFFLAMALQVPLIALSSTAKSLGNTLVWCSLFLGQPVLELLYAREFFLAQASRTGKDLLCLQGP